jgi:hypothetical protein
VTQHATSETRQSANLLGQLGAQAAATRERIEAAGSLAYGRGPQLLEDLERLRRILDALDAIAQDPVA